MKQEARGNSKKQTKGPGRLRLPHVRFLFLVSVSVSGNFLLFLYTLRMYQPPPLCPMPHATFQCQRYQDPRCQYTSPKAKANRPRAMGLALLSNFCTFTFAQAYSPALRLRLRHAPGMWCAAPNHIANANCTWPVAWHFQF
jgi:hypothetical protein